MGYQNRIHRRSKREQPPTPTEPASTLARRPKKRSRVSQTTQSEKLGLNNMTSAATNVLKQIAKRQS